MKVHTVGTGVRLSPIRRITMRSAVPAMFEDMPLGACSGQGSRVTRPGAARSQVQVERPDTTG
jgi:hypothetical protein